MDKEPIKKIESKYESKLRVFLSAREYLIIFLSAITGFATLGLAELEGAGYQKEYIDRVRPLYSFGESAQFSDLAVELQELITELETNQIPWSERIPAIKALIKIFGEELPEDLPDTEIEIMAQLHEYYFLLKERKLSELSDKSNLVMYALILMCVFGLKVSQLERRYAVLSQVITELNYYVAVQGKRGTELQRYFMELIQDCQIGLYINEDGFYEASIAKIKDSGGLPMHTSEMEF